MPELNAIRQQYRELADNECGGYCPAYSRLALDVAQDDELVAFIADMPVVQPNLFLAAIQYLTGPDEMPATGAGVRRLLDARGGDVARLMRSRRTQTPSAILLSRRPRLRSPGNEDWTSARSTSSTTTHAWPQ